MSAEILRRAASLIRKRAEKAEPTTYGFTSKWTTPQTMLTRITAKDRVVAEVRNDGGALYDLNHLSHWHPAVALAVADWLDAAYADWHRLEHSLSAASVRAMSGCENLPSAQALAVARAYLQEGDSDV